VIPGEWYEPIRRYADETDEETCFRFGFAGKTGKKSGLKSYVNKPPPGRQTRDALGLGSAFDKALESFRQKLSKAMKRDEAATIRVLEKVIATPYPKPIKFLDLDDL
jgi:hypothetical protein